MTRWNAVVAVGVHLRDHDAAVGVDLLDVGDVAAGVPAHAADRGHLVRLDVDRPGHLGPVDGVAPVDAGVPVAEGERVALAEPVGDPGGALPLEEAEAVVDAAAGADRGLVAVGGRRPRVAEGVVGLVRAGVAGPDRGLGLLVGRGDVRRVGGRGRGRLVGPGRSRRQQQQTGGQQEQHSLQGRLQTRHRALGRRARPPSCGPGRAARGRIGVKWPDRTMHGVVGRTGGADTLTP